MEANNQTDWQIFPYLTQQQPMNISESQVMNNLNFSIENLLSKIEKVTEDYEISNQELQFSQPIISHKNSINETDRQKQVDRSLMNQVPRNNQSDSSTSVSEKEIVQKKWHPWGRQNNKQGHATTHVKYSKPKLRPYTFHFNLHQKSNPKDKKQEHRTQTHSFTTKKINSLFDKTTKQIGESKIVKEVDEQGTFDRLEKIVKPVKESLVTSVSTVQLRDFEVGTQIGSGKFGSVYLCRHKVTGCLFALKKVFKSTIRENRMQQQFALQLKVLYLLDHQHIVKLYTHFQDEYHGGELMKKLKSQEQYVSRVINQLIDAVGYIHHRGVVHRDIKPQNIIIGFDNTVKLCDFGWAGTYDYKTLKTTFCGTLDYVSPEMKDKGKYDTSVDLWSLGVLTYELLTGVAPFRDEIANWRKEGSKRNVKWNWHIFYPRWLSAISQSFMRNLLKQNPDDRGSLYSCRNHFFIRKYIEKTEEINTDFLI